MNPSYPVNGNPYPSSPSPFHQPAAAPSPANGQSPHIPSGMPNHVAHYSYALHHPSSYPQHGYPSYPSYPSSGMMHIYSSPQSGHPESSARSPAIPSPAPPSASTAGTKRKRKSSDGPFDPRASNQGHPTDSSGDIVRTSSTQGSSTTVVDTKKRTKTQRACDSCRSRKIRCDVLSDSDPPVCQHCKQYGFECTFFLPITETRFKKKKLEEEAAQVAAEKDKEGDRSTHSPQADNGKNADVRVFGPTSATYMLHSQAMISSRAYESFDMRYHHSWDQGELQLALPKPVDLRIERDVVEKLVNAYFTDVAPMLPIVTRDEFIASSPPPPVLLYAMCLIAAASRDVPQNVYDSIRYAVNSLIKAEDVMSTASTVNMQALLILAMCGDCHSQFVPNALSALWIRLGCAIRMGQDLGFHRAESVKQNIELRRRLWGICVISDRWISLTYGHPYMIDVQDCDARLPSSGDPNDRYLDELVRLSVVLGRVMKAIYTPAGLTVTTDEQLYALLAEIDAWKSKLPEDLRFHGPDTPQNAGLLFMFYVCVNILFWRVFMRISYACPAHLKFALTVEKWTELVQLSGQVIDWLDAHEQLYDVWLLVAYCATSCALVQNAEIIALLYEATQGQQDPTALPALNPTGGVKGKPPLTNSLVFKKDPSRPGGGVFVAHTKPKEGEVDEHLPEGTIISGDATEGEMPADAVSGVGASNDLAVSSVSSSGYPAWSSASVAGSSGQDRQQHQQPQVSSQRPQEQMQQDAPMVQYPQSDGSYSNVNPVLNDPSLPGNVQVMNVLDVPQASNTLEQLAMADTAFMEGIPNSMFEWNQWDHFFARFAPQLPQFQQQQRGDAGMQPASSPQAHTPQQQYHYPSGM
ncbi:hypothetical protein EVJ58_g1874 [Rhodofomes roseus]|uniref:Zn(2)-C6 fungal-type domain-containing protein n=1 Tax=Rhodofomes roseus TaxID=34475 RepID=A0A4Y9YZD5_9APHY|nr:hypothetical protein EVJ58_g1874 [Rhodofomes roseus]